MPIFRHEDEPASLRSTVTVRVSRVRTWPHRRPREASSANGVAKRLRAGLARPSVKYMPDCQPPFALLSERGSSIHRYCANSFTRGLRHAW